MNIKKGFLLMLITLFFASPFLLASCSEKDSLPDGFIRLDDAVENAKGVMSYIFFEDYFSLVDIDGYSVGGALETDRSLLINYQGEYYINEEKFLEALEIAKTSPEQRQKRYSLEDAIEMRGADEKIYIVKITTFELAKKGDVTTYTIKYTVTTEVAEHRNNPYVITLNTKDDVSYSVFLAIDIKTVNVDINDNMQTDTMEFSVDICENREIDTIHFLSPDFPWFEYIIAVDKKFE